MQQNNLFLFNLFNNTLYGKYGKDTNTQEGEEGCKCIRYDNYGCQEPNDEECLRMSFT